MLYAVRVGREVGIFNTWDECKQSVDKYSGAEYRKVKSVEEGERYIRNDYSCPKYGYYIDGSYMDKYNGYGYSVVVYDKVVRYQEFGRVPKEYRKSRNIGAEFYASLRALSIIERIGSVVEPIIYYDYEGVLKFLEGWEPRTDLARDYKLKASNLLNYVGPDVKFIKVDAHSGDEYNDMADSLAKQGAMTKSNRISIVTNMEELRHNV